MNLKSDIFLVAAIESHSPYSPVKFRTNTCLKIVLSAILLGDEDVVKKSMSL